MKVLKPTEISGKSSDAPSQAKIGEKMGNDSPMKRSGGKVQSGGDCKNC
jgi:hypothetical protein